MQSVLKLKILSKIKGSAVSAQGKLSAFHHDQGKEDSEVWSHKEIIKR
jgi:hypothetical protein